MRRFSPATVRAYAFDFGELRRVPRRSIARVGRRGSDRPLPLPGLAVRPGEERPDRGGAPSPGASTGDDESSHRRRAGALRASGHHRRARREPGAGGPPVVRTAGAAQRPAGPLRRPGPIGRATGAPTMRLPESLAADDVAAFVADLDSRRDRAMVLAMVLGGLRAAEVRSLRQADVDMGLRRVRVVGKGDKERVVPIDGVFFTECAAYLRSERPAGCRTPQCFVVLRGPTRGQPMTEAGLRKVFRTHRGRSGARSSRRGRIAAGSAPKPPSPSWVASPPGGGAFHCCAKR